MLGDTADHADLDAHPRAVLQHSANTGIADLRVGEEQMLLRLADERGQQLARVLRTHDQAFMVWGIGLSGSVRLEQGRRLLDETAVEPKY
jgi:hypothetical protein